MARIFGREVRLGLGPNIFWRVQTATNRAIRKQVDQDSTAMQEAAVVGVRAATVRLKDDIRDITDSIFTGSESRYNKRASSNGSRTRSRRRVSNAIRDIYFDTVDGQAGAAGVVISRFGRGKGSGFVDYLLPHVTGQPIRPRQGEYLFIGTDAAGAGGVRLNARRGVFGNTFSIADPDTPGQRLLFRRTATGEVELIASLVREVRFRSRAGEVSRAANRREGVFNRAFEEALARRGFGQ